MADAVGNIDAKEYGFGIEQKSEGFFVKGASHLGWGLQDRLRRIFNPVSGNTVMLAFDHGYIMGPTSGLERMDLTIVPLIDYADCIMCTRGTLRQVVPPTSNKPVALRVSAGTTILTDLNNECLIDMEEAIRLNASIMAPMVAIGSPEFEGLTIRNLTRLVDMGNKYGIPVLGVTAVGKDLVRDSRYISMASRVLAENGAHVVKTYFCEEGFEKVVAACPVPIVIAGGKKLPEAEALGVAYRAIQAGAAGVDMGRNVFQSECPAAMIQAVGAVVHEGLTPEQGFEKYNDLKASL
ncbi:MAG: 3-hydroxy-5-phosphonooxypentane-2,4-dione thiolase [Phycisphaerales bacterium]|nr:3-hydroxy-5-phosphonooxypentane-2,4-dione thiolase [Phycisphaerales bacterium]